MLVNAVPMLDLGHQHRIVADDVAAGFARVLASNSYVLGAEVTEFERAYADHLGVAHVVGVGNGTDALELALLAAGIGAGDEVIVPADTFVATAEAVVRVGADLRLIDVGVDHLIDLAALAQAVTGRTRAVIPVHLYGAVVDVAALRKIVGDDIVIIEDAAQSQGARLGGRAAGALGDAAATSFYPGKNLGAYGDAGAVSTDDADVADRVRALRNHGGLARYEHRVVGTNSRLDSLQAVVLSAKLRHLDDWNDERRSLADRYRVALAGSPIGLPPAPAEREAHVYHQFVIELDDRDRIYSELSAVGIGVGIHYPLPIHLLPAFARLGVGQPGDFPRAERRADRILSLPIYPGLPERAQDRVVEQLLSAIG